MNQIVTKGIVLTRTDYGEADRILTIITPDQGKIRVIAKGVRKIKSKLAGGIELFSVSDVSYIAGRKEIGTLVSTRLDVHYEAIVADLDRTMFGYELLKRINRATEDAAGEEYFDVLHQSLEALNSGIELGLLEMWFTSRLLTFAGHQPNLRTDARQQSLSDSARFSFDFDNMCFAPAESGTFKQEHIKLLRLAEAATPQQLASVQGADQYGQALQPLLATLLKQHLSHVS